MPSHQPLVLIGEPDRATFTLYQRALEGEFGVIAAPDAAMLERLLRSEPLAALVLEPAIFAIPAWEQAAAAGQICAERGIALVICSTQDERRRSVELGAVAYLLKPALPTALRETLRKVLGVERS
jgi:DNA-binding response OmpR family regulator